MKRGTRAWLIVVVMLAAAAGGTWYYLSLTSSDDEVTGAEENLLAAEASQGSVRVMVEGPGSVSPVRALTVRAGIAGVLTRAAETGESYSAGQVVAQFDTAELVKAVRQAELNLAQVHLSQEGNAGSLSQARGELEKLQRLEESGAATRDQVDQAASAVGSAEFALRNADLSVKQAELALESARANLEKATVRAPFSGVVLESNVSAGDMVGSGSSLLVFADLSRVRIDAEIDEYDIGKVERGMRVSVTGDALGDDAKTSTVDRISPAAEVVNNIPIFTVSTIVDNSDGSLRPGMNTDLEILISSDKGVVVPSKAVSTVRSRSYVDVVADGAVETRRVTIGADDGMNVAVLEGLEAGDLVVLPQTAGLTLTTGTAPTNGSSIIPINIPGTGGGSR